MAKKNKLRNKHLAKRAVARMDYVQYFNNETVEQLSRAYKQAINDINNDIDRIFYRYATKHGLTNEEAVKALSDIVPQAEVDNLLRQLASIKNKTVRRQVLSRLNVNPVSARITRLEALKDNIYLKMKQVGLQEIDFDRARLADVFKSSYYRSHFDYQQVNGVGYSFNLIDNRRVEEALKTNWSGRIFSDRVWSNTDILAERLKTTVTKGIMSGKSMPRLVSEISDLSNVGRWAAERLIRTETAFITNQADLEAARARGTKHVETLVLMSRVDK